PPQYEGYPGDLVFNGSLADGVLTGTTNAKDGSILTWRGVPAPEMRRAGVPSAGVAIDLIDSIWHVRWPEMDNHWTKTPEGLVNAKAGT
ncbi:hypothetical protein ABTE17_20485, partial [Acinetobacter baumannii]